MIGRLVALGAAVAAAAAGAGAAIWAKRKAEEDAALEREILGIVEDEATAMPVAKPAAEPAPAADADDGTRADADDGTRADADDGTRADADDLTDIKGIGAISKERLDSIGVTTFAQIAAWSDDDLEAASAIIKISPERIRREDWVAQARARVER